MNRRQKGTKNWSNFNEYDKVVRVKVSLDYAASVVNTDAVLEV